MFYRDYLQLITCDVGLCRPDSFYKSAFFVRVYCTIQLATYRLVDKVVGTKATTYCLDTMHIAVMASPDYLHAGQGLAITTNNPTHISQIHIIPPIIHASLNSLYISCVKPESSIMCNKNEVCSCTGGDMIMQHEEHLSYNHVGTS